MDGFQEARFTLTIFSNERIYPRPQLNEAVFDVSKFAKLNRFKLQKSIGPSRIDDYEELNTHWHDDVGVTFVIFGLHDACFGFVFQPNFDFLRRHDL